MIYTVGYAPTYDPYMAADPIASKRAGGSVWETRKQAERYLGPGFKVYGVEADWLLHTGADESSHEWHQLLIDGVLVSLEKPILPEERIWFNEMKQASHDWCVAVESGGRCTVRIGEVVFRGETESEAMRAAMKGCKTL